MPIAFEGLPGLSFPVGSINWYVVQKWLPISVDLTYGREEECIQGAAGDA